MRIGKLVIALECSGHYPLDAGRKLNVHNTSRNSSFHLFQKQSRIGVA